MTETQAMVAKLPVLKGKCDTVTMMAYGFDPYLSKWSPYVGAHHRNPAERQRKLETIPAFEDLAPFHEQTDGHDGRVRTGGEEYRAFLDFMARAARAVHGHAAADPGFAHPAGGGKKGSKSA